MTAQLDLLSPAVSEQPAPTEGSGEEVWPLLIGLESDTGTKADMMLRHRLGVVRYGTALRTWNGRDAATDAYQEALDLRAYHAQMQLRLASIPEENRTEAQRKAVQMLDTLSGAIGATVLWLSKLAHSGVVPVKRPEGVQP